MNPLKLRKFLFGLFEKVLKTKPSHFLFFAVIGIRLPFEASTLDWNMGDVPIHLTNNIMEGLYQVDEQGIAVAVEAESLPVRKADGVYEIRLRENLKWSDGAPITAQNYIDSWARLKNPKTGSMYASLLTDITEFTAKDARTIVVRSRDLMPALFSHWSLFPIRKDFIDARAQGWTKNPTEIPVNGPYKIVGYKSGPVFSLAPNAQNLHPGTLSQIDFITITDDLTAFRLFEQGKLHFMSDLAALSPATRSKLSQKNTYFTKTAPVLLYLGVDPNQVPKPLRQSLFAALSRQEISQILDLKIRPTVSVSPFQKRDEIPAFAGMTNKNSVMPAKAGIHPLLDSHYFEKGNNRQLMEWIQAQWKTKLNLKTLLQGHDVKSYWGRLHQKPFAVFLNSYGPPIWEEAFYFRLLTSTNPMNLTGWKNPDYDAAVAKKDWTTAQKILFDEAPVIPLYFRTYEYLLSPELKGVTINPMTSLFLSKAQFQEN